MLSCILSITPTESQTKALHSQTETVENRKILIRLSIQHGLVGLLYRHLMDAGLIDRFSESQIEKLKSHYYRIAAANVRSIENLCELLSIANRKGIPIILIQGAPLLLEVYKDFGLRPMMDIDLWVNAKDISTIRTVLCGLGYDSDPIYPDTFRRDTVTLDIHTHPLGADRIKTRIFQLSENMETLRKRCRKITVNDVAWIMDDMDQFICLSLHALKHGINRWIWLADILNFCNKWPESKWQELICRADTTGQLRGVGYILFILNEIERLSYLNHEKKISEKFKLTKMERRTLCKFNEHDPLPEWLPLLLVSSKVSFPNKLAYYFETLFPRPEVMRQVFLNSPDSATLNLYVRRIAQLFKMGFSSLFSSSQKNISHHEDHEGHEDRSTCLFSPSRPGEIEARKSFNCMKKFK